jgi:hypothetical protein
VTGERCTEKFKISAVKQVTEERDILLEASVLLAIERSIKTYEQQVICEVRIAYIA